MSDTTTLNDTRPVDVQGELRKVIAHAQDLLDEADADADADADDTASPTEAGDTLAGTTAGEGSSPSPAAAAP
jgi:predicted AAA+ superfamily ATPase